MNSDEDSFKLSDNSCNCSVPIYSDILTDIAELHPTTIMSLSEEFDGLNAEYITDDKQPEYIVNNYVEEELVVNSDRTGGACDSDINIWDSVKIDDHLEVMYQIRCDFCDRTGKTERNKEDIESHNHKKQVTQNRTMIHMRNTMLNE